MQDLILVSFSKHELQELIKESVTDALNEKQQVTINVDSDKLLSMQEASEFLNLAKQTIYGFTSQNSIPHIKKGKKLYFNKIELIQWLNESKNESVRQRNQVL